MQKKRSNEELCVAAQQGDEVAIAQLVENNLPFIRWRANRIWEDQPATNSALGVTIEDLIQVGCEELLRSVPDFDARRKVLFLTYAEKRIKNKMIDYLKQQKMLLQFSPTDRDAMRKIMSVEQWLTVIRSAQIQQSFTCKKKRSGNFFRRSLR